jgi:hypothetical protein
MSLGITGAPSGSVTTGAADGARSELSAGVGIVPRHHPVQDRMSTAPSMSIGGGVEGRVRSRCAQHGGVMGV